MRWYRQHPRELTGDEPSDLVALTDEEVIDAAHHRDARVRDRGTQLVRGPELVFLGSHDECARRDLGELARFEIQVFRSHPDKRNGVRPSAARELSEALQRAEPVPDEAKRQGRRERTSVIDRRPEIIPLRMPSGPFAV